MKLWKHAGIATASACLWAAAGSQKSEAQPALLRVDHVVEVPGGAVHAWEVTVGPDHEAEGSDAPVVIFVHGGTWSGRPNFDLRFKDYSTMEHFARRGWDTFAFDARGYGESSEPEGENWSEATDAVKDLHVVVEHIQGLRSVEKVHLVGWSWGSQVAALFAQEHPELTARIVLYGTRWQAYPDAPVGPTERFQTSTLEDAKSDFIEGCYDPALVEAYAKAALAADPASPNGVYRDYFVNLPIIDPEKLITPVLIISGEHEAQYALDDIAPLFQAIAATDKQLSVIPGGGHAVHFEKGRHRWRSTVLAFLGAVAAD